jgi:hypothetical protein
MEDAAIQLSDRRHGPRGGVLDRHFHDRAPRFTQRTVSVLPALPLLKNKLIT